MLKIDRNIDSYYDIDVYIAWVDCLKLYNFWMAYNADRWPTDLTSHWEN